MMSDLPTVLLTALKLALALSVVSLSAFLCWLAWCLRAALLQDADDAMNTRYTWDDLDELEIPSDATVEVCGEVFSAEEARWLHALQRIWQHEPVEVR